MNIGKPVRNERKEQCYAHIPVPPRAIATMDALVFTYVLELDLEVVVADAFYPIARRRGCQAGVDRSSGSTVLQRPTAVGFAERVVARIVETVSSTEQTFSTDRS